MFEFGEFGEPPRMWLLVTNKSGENEKFDSAKFCYDTPLVVENVEKFEFLIPPPINEADYNRSYRLKIDRKDEKLVEEEEVVWCAGRNYHRFYYRAILRNKTLTVALALWRSPEMPELTNA